MRAAVLISIVLVAACDSGRLASVTGSTGTAGPDAGANPAFDAGAPDAGGADAGAPDAGEADAGAPDAGGADASAPDAGGADAGAPDAGAADAGSAPGTIGAVDCPAIPQLIWSRTFTDEVDFRGVRDHDGNLYWVDYDSKGLSWLASADGDGSDRYRAAAPIASEEGVFLIAGGKVVLSKGAVFAAYDAATGAQSWTLDLSATFTNGYTQITGLADLGNGQLAFSMSDYAIASGLYVADLTTGAIAWSSVSSDSSTGFRVNGSNGAGSFLGTTANPDKVFVSDSSGHQLWSQALSGGSGFLLWASGAPWLGLGTGAGLAATADYVVVPSTWVTAVQGQSTGFALSIAGSLWSTPIGVEVIQGGALVAQGSVAGTTIYNGISAWPFLAGDNGDHLILLSQNWHSLASLCHPSGAFGAAISRFDKHSSYQCPLPFSVQGNGSEIAGAALLPGRLVVGRRTIVSYGCDNHSVNPTTIEAYALPGEALAPSGWVQYGGNPAISGRPR